MKYGQHFLTSKSVVEKIINAADVTKSDIVLEIGPGKGVLTTELAKRARKVYAVEIDPKMLHYIKDLKLTNVQIINKDILKYDFPKDITKIVSNLPYQISSPITEKIFDFGKPAVLMYQKEFGARMLTKPGDKNYSRLSILASYMAEVEKVTFVSREDFSPRPRVDSVVLKVKPKNIKKDPKVLFVAKLLFQHKRKLVIPALISERKQFKIEDKKELREILRSKLDSDQKVLDLTVDDIKIITKSVSQYLKV